MNNITLNFWELAFLAEACIPPRPIARMAFWDRLINDIYTELNSDELRERLFNYIIKNDCFNLENEDCQWFFARYNPKNQFIASCLVDGKVKEQQCFWKDGFYRVSKSKFINTKYVKCIDKVFAGIRVRHIEKSEHWEFLI